MSKEKLEKKYLKKLKKLRKELRKTLRDDEVIDSIGIIEQASFEADKILLDLLRDLEMDDIVRLYNKIEKDIARSMSN